MIDRKIMPDTENPIIFIFTALECEAKALISQFELKRKLGNHPFSIYIGKQVILTITGVGKNAMAGGVTYTMGIFSDDPNPILINIGIAGHKEKQIGSLMMADKIVDPDSQKVFYPQLIDLNMLETVEVQSVSKPKGHYSNDLLNDMEASAFYEMATKFSCAELIHSIKIVSDNEELPIENITAKKVNEWVLRHVIKISQLIKQLEQMRDVINPAYISDYEKIIAEWHFTVSGKVKLKALLNKWHVLVNSNWLMYEREKSYKNSKEILRKLAMDIDLREINL